MRSVWARAPSSSSLPFSTSLAAWRSVTSRAFSSPASTNFASTSLSTTGTSAGAITWAISPPMTPAPTTAALKTNMAVTLASAAELAFRRELVGEAGERAAQRVRELAAQEGPAQRGQALLGLHLERERDARLLEPGLEDHAPDAAHPGVLDLQHLPQPRLEPRDPLGDPALASGRGVPQDAAAHVRPVALELDEVAEAVHPRRPAGPVVPERLGLHRTPLHHDADLHRAHQAASGTSSRCSCAMRRLPRGSGTLIKGTVAAPPRHRCSSSSGGLALADHRLSVTAMAERELAPDRVVW